MSAYMHTHIHVPKHTRISKEG